jgi:2-oxoacid:acceptor oxidoreductase gamma subunit (pyruvate/2-ketoisovalerate family)
MIEVTLYGRGGQGGVTLAKLIATAYFLRGKHAQAFGVYAAERSGAPIQAYVRIDDEEITNHNQIREPDHVIVLDPTLIGPHVLSGMKPHGWVILNTPRPASEWGDLFPSCNVATVDATDIAVQHGLGSRIVPIVNTTMLGAIARVLGIHFDEVTATLGDLRFGGANLDAARDAYERVVMDRLPGSHIPAAAPVAAPPLVSLFDESVGVQPKVRTGSWATRKPERRTLTPPCNHTCPAGNDVQAFVAAMSRRDVDEAIEVLLNSSPLPGVCGRVCPAPCMGACNRNAYDEGVNVRELERFAADHGAFPEPMAPWRRQRVAVTGSGPAGLSASYHLSRLGYHVTLFEAADELGGVLRNGIPEYRLPREVLDREIGYILMHGVTAYTDARIDRGALLDLTNHYDAVFVATGLQESRGMDLATLPADSVQQGLEFLDRVHRHAATVAGGRVVVIGGGNTAIDAARTAKRLGAASVRIMYRRTRAEMPAIDEEIVAALEEGVTLDELVLPLRGTRDADGNLLLVCNRMILGAPDASGRRSPVLDDGPEAQFALPVDRVILALGQSADLSILQEGSEVHENGRLLGVSGAPVFLGGDFGRNEGTVAAAIGSGRRAAREIHRLLSGEDLLLRAEPPVAKLEDVRPGMFPHAAKKRGGAIAIELRSDTFAEVHTGLESAMAASAEADRCFSCGVCNQCDRCVQHCPEGTLHRRCDDYTFDLDYCKGCGVCASQCPRGVVVMSELQG